MASPLYTMRALANPGPGYVTWQYGYPDYAGVYAPAPILAGTVVIVSGPVPLESLGKLDTTHSPAGLWLFNDNLNDSSGNGFNLSVAGVDVYTTVARDYQKGLCFRAVPSRPSIDVGLAITGALTIESFGIFGNYDASEQIICSIGNTLETEADNTAYAFIINIDRSLGLFWESGAGVNRQVNGTAGIVPMSVPCHLVVTRSAGNPANIAFYVNGVSAGGGSNVAASGCTAASCRFRVGSFPSGGSALLVSTVLNSIKVLNIELTPAQVVAEYNRVLGGRGIVYPRL